MLGDNSSLDQSSRINKTIMSPSPGMTSTPHKDRDPYGKGIPGAPGVGFKLTSDGQFDLDGKRLCNVSKAIAENDVVTLSCMRSSVNLELDILKRAINNNKKRIADLESLENIIHDLEARVEASNNIINNQKIKINKLEGSIRSAVKSLLRGEDVIKEIKRQISELIKK
ncbi:hypothetical protein KQX54_014844 [Cotesia glomerata]|uniref:Uncharacterized protein n=1 Tax=Cotesia glomerata TaxID=32391 RepID=A0AAV7J547_COTGL|nr:hypothetical protein KQX54_008314 [Cotesia glomerata]KAH0567840.1 hypothetical protein KQX54_014844 [Cotesia glomerata]